MPTTDHRSTQRVIDILELLAFSERPEGFTLKEIAANLSCPKSSILPILRTLLKSGYLSLNSTTAGYHLGRRIYEIGSSYIDNDDFYFQAHAIMSKVVEACSETCHIAELDGTDVRYLLKVDSPEPIRMFSAPGKKLPAHATALGKALLSDCSSEDLAAIFPDGLSQVTPKTITDMHTLCEQLEEVRRTGFAFETEENAEFMRCIAVPLCKKGTPVMAISVSVPTFRYNDEKETLIKKLLVNAKAALEKII